MCETCLAATTRSLIGGSLKECNILCLRNVSLNPSCMPIANVIRGRKERKRAVNTVDCELRTPRTTMSMHAKSKGDGPQPQVDVPEYLRSARLVHNRVVINRLIHFFLMREGACEAG